MLQANFKAPYLVIVALLLLMVDDTQMMIFTVPTTTTTALCGALLHACCACCVRAWCVCIERRAASERASEKVSAWFAFVNVDSITHNSRTLLHVRTRAGWHARTYTGRQSMLRTVPWASMVLTHIGSS
jgi:hypothetical protein